MRFASILISVIGGIAILWYFICLIALGFRWPYTADSARDGFRQFMSLSLSTLSGTLATFVGLVLGIKTAETVNAPDRAAAVLQGEALSWLQMVAALAYVVSLFIALWAWYRTRDNADPTIQALGKSFLGLIVGAL